MKTRDLRDNPRASIISQAICYRTLGHLLALPKRFLSKVDFRLALSFIRFFSSFVGLKSQSYLRNLNFFRFSGVLSIHRFTTYLGGLMRRVLAPLRRIVSRELEVLAVSRVSIHPASFVVHDTLECGHVHTSLLWDIFDLLNGYTESAHVRAVRHRCQLCKDLTAKKPVQSVTVSKTAAVA